MCLRIRRTHDENHLKELNDSGPDAHSVESVDLKRRTIRENCMECGPAATWRGQAGPYGLGLTPAARLTTSNIVYWCDRQRAQRA